MYAIILIALALVAGSNDRCDKVNIRSSGDLSTAGSCTKIGSLFISGELTDVNLGSVQSVEDTIRVTATSTLQKFSMPKLQSAKDLEITNNSGLTSVSLPSLSELTGHLFVSGNSPEILFSAPKLGKIGGDSIFSNCTGIDVSGLKSAGNQVSFTGNAATNISLPNLSKVSSSLTFASNEQMTGLKLEKLTGVDGALVIANNTKLDSISFPSLTEIAGGLELYTSSSKIDFPALESIKGGAKVVSDKEGQTCDDLKKLTAVTEGSFQCQDSTSGGKSKNVTGGSKNSTASDSSDDATYTKLSLPLF
ncbi:protoplasts-secreted, partial [Massospora cicadina]